MVVIYTSVCRATNSSHNSSPAILYGLSQMSKYVCAGYKVSLDSSLSQGNLLTSFTDAGARVPIVSLPSSSFIIVAGDGSSHCIPPPSVAASPSPATPFLEVVTWE